MADWVDLTSTVRKTKGDVPPPLVGASVTLVDDSIYVFGGRPVASREMVDTLFALDLRRLVWNKLWPPTSPSASCAKGPTPRYFHSAAAWEDKLVVFGGQRFVPSSGTSKGDGHLETLDELLVWDTKKQSWSFPNTAVRNGARRPTPRYAHLSVVSTVSTEPIVLCPPSSSSSGSRQPSDTSTSSRLVIIGGQDYENNYVSDLSILDLSSMEWVSHAPYPRKAGTYRSVAAVAAVGVRPREERGANVVSSWAERPTEEREEPVYVFSNTNFAAPRRDFDRIPTLHDSLPSPAYTPLADSLTGDSLPPGLRFPHAYICGTHLVLSGADVGPDSAQFVVWTLELGKMRWERIPVEKMFGKRSWGPAVGWRNTLVVVGAGERHLLEDYASRQINFSQVAFVDLEGFGVYVPPSQSLPPAQQQLGLVQLSQKQLHDFVIVCSDKERLGCSRRVLEARWPWFAEELEAVRARHEAACEAREQSAVIGRSVGLADSSDDEPIDGALQRASSPLPTRQAPRSAGTIRPPSRIFPLTPSTLDLPLPSSDVKALLQYLYSLSLLTPLQRSLPTLSSFLSFTKTYDIVLPSLRTLIVHALHETLDDHPESAANVYEAAALGDSVALQIRAMQVMLKGGVAGDASPSAGGMRRGSASTDAGRSRYSLYSQASSLSAYSGLESSSDHGHSNVLRSPASHASSPPSSVYNGSGISSFKLTTPSSSLPPLPPHASPLPPLPQQNASLPSLPPPITQAPLPQPPSAQHSAAHSSYPASRPSYPVSRVQPSGRTSSLGVLSETSDASTFSHVPPQPPHARQVHSPTPSMAISSSTPARIAEAWREAEERDRQQRAEAHRLAAEAELARSAAALRLQTERKGSTVCVTFTPAPADQAAREFATSPLPPAVSPTPIVSGMYHQAGDTGSIRTNGSSGSGATKVSSEKVTQTAAVAVKAVKKGFFSSLIAGPTMHNAGVQRAVPTGPPVRKTYPAPRARTAKGAQALAAKAVVDDGASAVSGLSSGGSSGASFRF